MNNNPFPTFTTALQKVLSRSRLSKKFIAVQLVYLCVVSLAAFVVHGYNEYFYAEVLSALFGMPAMIPMFIVNLIGSIHVYLFLLVGTFILVPIIGSYVFHTLLLFKPEKIANTLKMSERKFFYLACAWMLVSMLLAYVARPELLPMFISR